MDYLRERRGRQELHPGVIVSSQDRAHLPMEMRQCNEKEHQMLPWGLRGI